MAKHKGLGHYKDHFLWWGGYSERQKQTSQYMTHMYVVWLRTATEDPEKRIDPLEFSDLYYTWQRQHLLDEIAKIKRRRWPFKERLMNHQMALLKLRLLRCRYRSIIEESKVAG